MQSSALSFAFFRHPSRRAPGASGLMILGIKQRLVATGKFPGWALIGQLGPVPTPGVGEGRFHPIPKGRCEALLPEEGRLDLGPAKAIE